MCDCQVLHFVCSHFSMKSRKNSLKNSFFSTFLLHSQNKILPADAWGIAMPPSLQKVSFWVFDAISRAYTLCTIFYSKTNQFLSFFADLHVFII